MSDERRRYTKRRRAEAELETRQRITEAAVELHGSVGPARTTISAVAERAGVQRATVYRHFPDEAALFAACSGHWAMENPPPDPAAWRETGSPAARLSQALTDLYSWFRRNAAMLENVTRDRPLVAAMAEPAAAMEAYFGAVVETLVAGRPERGHARRRVKAALGHATSFTTWQSLAGHQALDDSEAAAMMATMVEAAGRSVPVRGNGRRAPRADRRPSSAARPR
jgi:AcrR family transcriptional regulator